jgi:hypothetical protein
MFNVLIDNDVAITNWDPDAQPADQFSGFNVHHVAGHPPISVFSVSPEAAINVFWMQALYGFTPNNG